MCNRPAPYSTGYTLFKHVRDQEGFARTLELRQFHEDISLIDLALTEELVRRHALYDRREGEATRMSVRGAYRLDGGFRRPPELLAGS